MIRATMLESVAGVRCALSTREDETEGASVGLGSFPGLRSSVELAFGVTPETLAVPQQCHSATVRLVTGPGSYVETDALVTRERGLWLRVVVADCVPIFLVEPRVRAVAAIHAGWRGTSAGITRDALRIMTAELGGNPQIIRAYVGPAAGVCCYEVGEEVARLFSEEETVRRGGKAFVDLKAANVRQLQEAGVRSENIEVSPFCTVCNPRMFHSYRRDRDNAGRTVGIISITR